MTDTDLAELARLQKLRDAATAGPWSVGGYMAVRGCTGTIEARGRHLATVFATDGLDKASDANAAFIASAHDAVALAERLAQRLQEARAEVIEQCAQLCEAVGVEHTPFEAEYKYLRTELPAAIRALKPTEGKP